VTALETILFKAATHVVDATAVLIVAAALDAYLRPRGRHALRAAAWWAALLRLSTPGAPGFGFVLPAFATSGVASAAYEGPAAPPAVGAFGIGDGFGVGLGVVELAGVVVIGGAAVAAALRIGAGIAFRRSVFECATPASAELSALCAELSARVGLRRPPPILLSGRVGSPCVVGFLRPTIALPLDDAAAPTATLRAALAHELVHVRRGDAALLAALAAVRCVFWFHPLAALLVARLGELRELSCDAEAARVLEDVDAYREALAATVARHVFGATPSFAPSWISAESSIVVRLRGLLRRESAFESAARRGAPLLATLAFACAPTLFHATEPTAPSTERAAALSVLQNFAAGGRESCFAVRYATFRLATDSAAPSPPLSDLGR
jgi:beta-lactamase regulating signal transducer with metallopeptidase domain